MSKKERVIVRLSSDEVDKIVEDYVLKSLEDGSRVYATVEYDHDWCSEKQWFDGYTVLVVERG